MFFLDKFSDFSLDVVGFLAILGEGCVTANAHAIGLSSYCYWPRLLPAPQALLPAQRPTTLRNSEGHVTAVFSGNMITGINHVANVLVDTDDMKPFEVRCVEISRRVDAHGQPVSKMIRARPLSPTLFLTLLGCAGSIGLLVASAVLDDGMSLVATVLLSVLGSLTGLGNRWDMPEPEGAAGNPAGDLVVRYPNGSFLVVKCNDVIARELYFTRRDIDYRLERRGIYRTISLAGTMLLMCGVIFLANATRVLQISWAAVFLILNASYWAAAAVPKRWHWDFSCYQVVEHSIHCEGGVIPEANQRFTDALWQAILFAKGSAWATFGEAAAPRTKAWDIWLEKAEHWAKNSLVVNDGKGSFHHTDWHGVEYSGLSYAQPSLQDWNPRRELGEAIKKAGTTVVRDTKPSELVVVTADNTKSESNGEMQE